MNTSQRIAAAFALAGAATQFASAAGTQALSANQLVEPATLVVDASLPKAQADAQILAARRYDTFWTTGEEALARDALAPDFMDRTLPPGRPQGVSGPLAASNAFRAAVPDIHCAVEQMIVSGDRVVTHLRFTGHFTGVFNGIKGRGQAVDFIATDIYRVAGGRIAENWHLEDNLTFLQQIGVVPK
jgi:predicted ester cyclase